MEERERRPDKKEKKEKRRERDKKEKTEKKDRRERKAEGSERSEEDKDVAVHAVVRETAMPRAGMNCARAAPVEGSDTQSQESDDDTRASRKRPVQFAHRVYRPGPSSLKRQRAGPRRGAARLSWADDSHSAGSSRPLETQVSVVSYRDLNEALWFTNPQANVMCERCKRRVPQKMGLLRGGTGGSSFMCSEFLCADCVDVG